MPSPQRLLLLAAWACGLWGSLQVARIQGDWGHALCGPWGCGPPLQALVACHLAWLVLLTPAAWVLFRGWIASPRARWRVSGAAALVGLLMMLGVVVHERLVWLPKVEATTAGYFWQRCGFVMATSVDLPMVQLFLLGLAGLLTSAKGARECGNPSDEDS